MFGRPILVSAGLLAAVIAAAWLRAAPTILPVGSPQLESGRFYAIDLSAPCRSIDLELDSRSRYEMIVSSLGDAGQTHRVSLAAIPRTRVETFPATLLTPINLRQPGHEPKCRSATDKHGFLAPQELRAKTRQHPPEALAREGVITSSLARRVSIPSLNEPGDVVSDSVVMAGKRDSATAAAQRRFFLHVTADALEDERGYVPVEGILAGEGKHVRVYLDRQVSESDLAPGLIGEVIRLLDDEIIPRSRELLGVHTDVDGDGKLAVLVTAWLGKLCGGRTSLKGFVRANDFQDHVAAPFGNHADLVYLNSSVEPGRELQTLLAHEYTHAVCFSRRLADDAREAPLPAEEDWLNEAIAHVAENLHASNSDWSNLDWRIAAFLNSPQNSPLVVRDYYRAGLWRDPGCRGATYLFLRYCVDQSGEQLLRDLVDSPAVGKRNLERATGVAFAELFRRWTIALAQDQIASVRLHEKIGNCHLAGLARREWHPEMGPCEINLRGTSTARVVLKPAGEARAVRIVIHGEPAARLQLTLVRHLVK